MSRAFAITMTRPHEKLGLPQPLGRRLPRGISILNVSLLAATLVLISVYVVQVNRAAARGFQLRDVEKKVETLRTEVRSLEDRVATLSSVKGLTERAGDLGFVPVERLEFVNPASGHYAVAK